MDEYEEIILIDPELNQSYPIRLSYEDAERARNDMNFASALLRYAQSFPMKKKVEVGQKSIGADPVVTTSTSTSPKTLCSSATTSTSAAPTLSKTLDSAAIMSTFTVPTSSTLLCSVVPLENLSDTTFLETATSKTAQSEKENIATAPSPTKAPQFGPDDGKYNWSKAQSRLLISLYGENEKMFGAGKHSQKQCWDRISMLMAKEGHIIPAAKCDSKFQSLKRTYKSTKDHNNKSGNSKKTWEYYEDMENILKKKPWVEPLSTAGSDDVNCDSPIAMPKTAKSKQSEYLKELLAYKKERAVKRDSQHTEKLNALADLRDLMRQHLNNT